MQLKGSESLALSMAQGNTMGSAANLAGISFRTAKRRWRDPEFRDYVKQLRADVLGRACGLLIDGAVRAAEVLRELLDSESESIRLSAAKGLLDALTRVLDHTDLEQRIRDLEERAKAVDGMEITPRPTRRSWPDPADARKGKPWQ